MAFHGAAVAAGELGGPVAVVAAGEVAAHFAQGHGVAGLPGVGGVGALAGGDPAAPEAPVGGVANINQLVPGPVQVPGPVAPIRWLGAGNLNRNRAVDRPLTADEEDEKIRQKLRDNPRVHYLELLTYNHVPEPLTRNRPAGFVTKVHSLYGKYHDSSVTRRQMFILTLEGRRMSKEFTLASKKLDELRDDIYGLLQEMKKTWKKFKIKAPPYLLVDPDLLPPH